jgi:hypothetical protein
MFVCCALAWFRIALLWPRRFTCFMHSKIYFLKFNIINEDFTIKLNAINTIKAFCSHLQASWLNFDFF